MFDPLEPLGTASTVPAVFVESPNKIIVGAALLFTTKETVFVAELGVAELAYVRLVLDKAS